MNDEELPKPPPQAQFPRKLESLSLEALRYYIGELEAEIERVRKDIVAKESVRSEAESLFKK